MTMKQLKSQSSKTGGQETARTVSIIILVLAWLLIVGYPSLMTGRINDLFGQVTNKPYREAHFATYPPDLIEPCIKAGSEVGDTIIDPFMGSGTSAMVAKSLGRYYLGCELHEDYGNLIQKEYKIIIQFKKCHKNLA